jgi:hypothetical protein
MLRKMLQLSARVGHPGAGLTVGDSDGRRLYVEARTHPLSVVVPLERDQVRQLVAVCQSWLAEREQTPTCAHRRSAPSVQI